MINTFHKNHPDKLTTMSTPIDFTLPIAKSIANLVIKPTLVSKKNMVD